MRTILRLAAAGAIGLGGTTFAQQPMQPLPATTVQLPSFSYFSVNTTVSVPDRGGAFLGGINRARDGSTTRGFGPLANRGIGGDRLAGGASVHATIIDHDELDRAILAAAAARRIPADPVLAKADAISRHVGRGIEAGATAGLPTGATAGLPSSAVPADSVAAIKARNAAAAEERASEAAGYFAKAQAAEADGKPAVAKIYYQMVVRRDAGPLKQRAELRLAALSGKQGATVAKR
jgi:hypothetical protein